MAANPLREPEINKLFRMVLKHDGAALHLETGSPPAMYLRDRFRNLDMPPLSADQMKHLVEPIIPSEHPSIFSKAGETSFNHVVGSKDGQFRVTVYNRDGVLKLAAHRLEEA